MKPLFLNAKWGRVAIWIAALLILAEGGAPLLLNRFRQEREFRLGGPDLPIRPDSGHGYIGDLARLDLASWADSNDDHQHSPLILTEDGRPLRPHGMHDDIRQGTSQYSHWGTGLYFSTSDGSDPRSNGRAYVIRYRALPVPFLELAGTYAFTGAALLLFGLAAASRLGTEDGLAAAISRRGSIAILGAALLAMMLCQVWQQRHTYAITLDSKTYVELPGHSVRPPGYYAFMSAVADPERVREAVLDLVARQQFNIDFEGDRHNPIVRVVFAQNVLLAIVMAASFVGLAACLSPALAAAITLLIGQFTPKVAISFFSAGGLGTLVIPAAAATVLLAPLWLQAVRTGGRRGRAAFGVFLFAGAVLGAVFPLAFQGTLVPDEHLVFCSETLAMAAELLMATSLVLYITRGGPGWLWLASLMAAAAFLIRPAAVFALVTVAAVGAISLLWPARRRWLAVAGAVGAGLVLMIAPSAVKKASHAEAADVSMLKWSLATYALAVAEPGDAARIANPDARELLERALVARTEARREIVVPDHWPYDAEVYRLGYYLYRILLPISKQMALQRSPGDLRAQATAWNGMMLDMALPIYRARWPSLVRMFAGSYGYALGAGSRLSALVPWWLTLIGVGILAVIGRGPLAGAGVALCAAHLLHMAVVCTFDVPINRYIYATEFMCLTGVLLIAWSCVLRLGRPPAASLPANG